MKKHKKIIDLLVIVLIAIFLFIALHNNWFQEYKGFALVPFLIVYYVGKYVGQRSAEDTRGPHKRN